MRERITALVNQVVREVDASEALTVAQVMQLIGAQPSAVSWERLRTTGARWEVHNVQSTRELGSGPSNYSNDKATSQCKQTECEALVGNELVF